MRAVTCMLMLWILAACGAPSAWNGHDIEGVMPDLDYRLTGEDGELHRAQEHHGRVRLMFFGFTNCPDVCPTTLAKLKSALAQLPQETRAQTRVLFVSVDPQRDGPQALATYTGYFGPQFLGFTGTDAQLETLTKRYRVTYGYGAPDESGDYAVSHSSAVLAFDTDGRARLLYNSDASAADIAADLTRLVEESPG